MQNQRCFQVSLQSLYLFGSTSGWWKAGEMDRCITSSIRWKGHRQQACGLTTLMLDLQKAPQVYWDVCWQGCCTNGLLGLHTHILYRTLPNMLFLYFNIICLHVQQELMKMPVDGWNSLGEKVDLRFLRNAAQKP